jgi:type IV pilus assembly protein PilB
MAPNPPDERRELTETAAVFEMIAEANPGDRSALEALSEIYTKLGDKEKLARVSARLGAARPAREATPPGAIPKLHPPPSPLGAPKLSPTREAAPPNPPRPSPPRESWPPSGPPKPFPARETKPPPRTAPKPRLREVGESQATRLQQQPLGDLLVAGGLITRAQLEQALRLQRTSKEKIGSILIRQRFISEDQLAGFLSAQYGVPSITLGTFIIDPDLVELVPADVAKRYDVVPIRREGETLTVAMADPVNVQAIDQIGFITGLRILPVVAAQGAIRGAIERSYEAQASGPVADLLRSALAGDLKGVEVVEDQEAGGKVDVFELKGSADEAPVVKLVNMVLVDAIQKGASDIHWEPYEKVFRVRFRVDGVLHEMLAPPKRLEPAILSRLKIMANLDIAERRLPQDGRIKLRYNTREIDFRVSVLPTIFGEKAVLRILDKDALKLDLLQLGFDPWSLEQFQKAIHQPYGMVLITGPTGSGKTTTLYSAIHTINSPEHNIMTAEDPVEYNLKGVNQVQINEGIGRTFATALRSFLRQDPDVILVGETRDLETAQISIRAALTGHLVFSTLHTNDCPSTVARLVDMGIPPFLVASALLMVLAQRLGRKVCKDCREPYGVDESTLLPYGHQPSGRGTVTLYRGRGCTACNSTGMKGRVAIYEIMPVTPELRDMILKGASSAELRTTAQSQGMKTLRQAGLVQALEGITTIEEVLRVTVAE